MARIGFRVTDEEKEVMVEQKEKLGLTWQQAMIRGLAIGPTPIEQAGLPDFVRNATASAMREDEFLRDLQEAQEE
jgi:hypothetical protein